MTFPNIKKKKSKLQVKYRKIVMVPRDMQTSVTGAMYSYSNR